MARHYSEMIAAGRIGRPEEAAEAALWLCSDAASYVTGHSMIVDGGLTLWCGRPFSRLPVADAMMRPASIQICWAASWKACCYPACSE